jgi:hypothetical protein
MIVDWHDPRGDEVEFDQAFRPGFFSDEDG